MVISLSSCMPGNSNSGNSTPPPVAPQTASTSGWNFTVLKTSVNKSLENISTSYGYNGDTSSEKITKQPTSGKIFLLVKMLIEKIDGTQGIDWKNVKISDSAGNVSARMDDNFLTVLSFKRIQGTSLSFGSYEGWIAFEINDGAKGLKFEYFSNNNPISIDLKI